MFIVGHATVAGKLQPQGGGDLCVRLHVRHAEKEKEKRRKDPHLGFRCCGLGTELGHAMMTRARAHPSLFASSRDFWPAIGGVWYGPLSLSAPPPSKQVVASAGCSALVLFSLAAVMMQVVMKDFLLSASFTLPEVRRVRSDAGSASSAAKDP